MTGLTIDVLIVAVLAGQLVLGWRYGLVRRAFALAGTFAAVVSASYAGNPLAGLVKADDPDANALCFLAIVVIVTTTFEVVGALASQHLRGLLVVAFDRVTGAAAGVLIGLLQVGLASAVILSAARADGATSGTVASDLHAAVLGSAVSRLEAGVKAVFAPVLPANLDDHLGGGHHLSTSRP